jgi:hypothetical protein
MAYSRSDLVTRAYQTTNLGEADEAAPSPAQLEFGKVTAASMVSTLSSKGIAIANGSVDAVPEDYFLPLSELLGVYLMKSNGGGGSADDVAFWESQIRQVSAQQASNAVLAVDYF